jgi:hypothetical protein
VLNWSISRNHKNIWNSTKDSVTTRMFVTHRPCGAKPKVKEAQGPAVHTLSWFRLQLDGYSPKSVYKSIPGPKVGGDWDEWSISHMDARLAIHHLQTNSIKLVEASLDLYIRILAVKFKTHTHTPHFGDSTYKAPILSVVVGVALS